MFRFMYIHICEYMCPLVSLSCVVFGSSVLCTYVSFGACVSVCVLLSVRSPQGLPQHPKRASMIRASVVFALVVEAQKP